MKIVLEIEQNRELKEDDIIIYRNGKWCITSKNYFLNEIGQKQDSLENRVSDLESNLLKLAQIVKEK